MEKRYYYMPKGGGQHAGPLTEAELDALAREGAIDLDTPVIVEGASTWVRYRDVSAGDRTGEMVEAVAHRAARVAAALQRPESRGFFLGMLMGITHLIVLPWRIIAQSARVVSGWGGSRFLPASGERLASGSLHHVGAPLIIVLYTAYWLFDCIAVLVVGRPAVSITLASWVVEFFLLGTPLSGQFSRASEIASAFGTLGFSDRWVLVLKATVLSYVGTMVFALLGDLWGCIASVGVRTGTNGANR